MKAILFMLMMDHWRSTCSQTYSCNLEEGVFSIDFHFYQPLLSGELLFNVLTTPPRLLVSPSRASQRPCALWQNIFLQVSSRRIRDFEGKSRFRFLLT